MEIFKHQINPPTTVEDEVSTDLNSIAIKDIVVPEGAKPILHRKMRVRQLDITPGGIIGYHTHVNRPAILYILKGGMIEYSSKHKEPRVWKAGDTLAEFNDVSHWAKNISETEPLSILTFDLLDDGEPCTGC